MVARSGGSREKYLGGLAPHHLGGNNGYTKFTIEPINSTSSRTTVSKNLGGWARFGGPVPPGPNVEPPLVAMLAAGHYVFPL